MQAASTSNVQSIDSAARRAFNTPDRPHSDTQALTHLRSTTHPVSHSPAIPTSDAQSSPSSFGPDHYASLRSTPVRSDNPPTSRPPPGLSMPANLPHGLYNLKDLFPRFKFPVRAPAQQHLPGHKPYVFGHLAFDYVRGELQRKKDSSQGSNGQNPG